MRIIWPLILVMLATPAYAQQSRSFAIGRDGKSYDLWQGNPANVPGLFRQDAWKHVDWTHYRFQWQIPAKLWDTNRSEIRWKRDNLATAYWLVQQTRETNPNGDIAWQWSAPADHHNAIVQIEGHRTGNSYRAGSGVYVVHKGCAGILTARHVVLDGPTATVVFQDGRRVSGRATGDKFGHDVAWIQIPKQQVEPLPFSAPKQGQVEINGFGGPAKEHRHFWAQLDLQGAPGAIAVSKVSATYGDSGGPWVQAGKVVGITSAVGGRQTSAREVRGPNGEPWIIGDMTTTADPSAIVAFLDRVVVSGHG